MKEMYRKVRSKVRKFFKKIFSNSESELLKEYGMLLDTNSLKFAEITTLKAAYSLKASEAHEAGFPVAAEVYSKCLEVLDDVLAILDSDRDYSSTYPMSKELERALENTDKAVGEFELYEGQGGSLEIGD